MYQPVSICTTTQLVQIDTGWYKLVQVGTDWYRLVQIGTCWYKQKRSYLYQPVLICTTIQLVQIGTDEYRLVQVDKNWCKSIQVIMGWFGGAWYLIKSGVQFGADCFNLVQAFLVFSYQNSNLNYHSLYQCLYTQLSLSLINFF